MIDIKSNSHPQNHRALSLRRFGGRSAYPVRMFLCIVISVIFLQPASSGYAETITDEVETTTDRVSRCVKAGDYNCVEEEIRKAKDAISEIGYDPLWTAIREGHKKMVELFLHNGWDINHGVALFYTSKIDMTRFLLTKGVDINRQDKKYGRSVAFKYVSHNDATENRYDVPPYAMIDFFLENGGDINVRNKKGVTLPMEAIQYDKKGMLKHLLASGVNINLKDYEGKTALHWSIDHILDPTDVSVTRLLVENGARTDARDRRGRTALHYAALKNIRFVRVLVEAGADPGIEDNTGESVLDLARKIRFEQLIAYLETVR